MMSNNLINNLIAVTIVIIVITPFLIKYFKKKSW